MAQGTGCGGAFGRRGVYRVADHTIRGTPPKGTCSHMAKPLVVVESPAKAKTISKFLGDALRRARLGGPRRRPARRRAWPSTSTTGSSPPTSSPSAGKQVVKDLRGGAEGRQRALSRDRRRPRGRGDQLAPARAPQAEGAREADGVPRDHRGRHRPRGRQPARHRLRPRRRRRDPADPRPALRLRGVAGAVAPGQPRPVGRPGAEPVDPPDRRARARAHRVRRRRLLGHRRSSPAPPPSFEATLVAVDGTRVATRQGLRRRRPGRPATWSRSTRRAPAALADGARRRPTFTRPQRRGEAVPLVAASRRS